MSTWIARIVAPLALVGVAQAQPPPQIRSSAEPPPAEQPPRDLGPTCDRLGMRTRPLPPPPPTEAWNVPAMSAPPNPNVDVSPSSQGQEYRTEAGIFGTQGLGAQGDGELSPGFFEGQPIRGEAPARFPGPPHDLHGGFGGGAPY
jgi:hypothetical protein